MKKVKIKMKNSLKFKKKFKITDEDLLPIAFAVNDNMPLPESYTNDPINEESMLFLKSVIKEGKQYERQDINSIFSVQGKVNNNQIFEDRYISLGISPQWRRMIVKEFESIRNRIHKEYLTNKKEFIDLNKIISDYKLQIENIKHIQEPSITTIEFCSKNMNNKICIKLIKHFNKLYMKKENIYVILQWVYFFLFLLKLPLIDEDNAELYHLNKNILNCLLQKSEKISNQEEISQKIIYILISEIFGQKIIT
jgi:hypothetical protein